ncbi:biotin-dependent carboxyltransferase family protein [Parasphingorhabdus sp.]|uniref:5-oxoprolinase subunit C family protein n=1 Tax=Parasphingorhabdus sp. TaxID=2709688 RepID=UPI003002815B
MSIRVEKAGLQTSLQGAPFRGHRHLGMPAAGAADCLSLALANFLVGKAGDAIAFEITQSEAVFTMMEACAIAVVGPAEFVRINGQEMPKHQMLSVAAGDSLGIGPSHSGCRTYLALSADIHADELLGGRSTCLAAGLGGFHGRALEDGDLVALSPDSAADGMDRATPEALRPHYGDDHLLRVVAGPEATGDSANLLTNLCSHPYTVGYRSSRMGMALEGPRLEVLESANMPSAAVFPGTLQLPPNGQPYLLGPDAQTTGGYPRIAQVIRADRHLIGQLRQGAKIQFVAITPQRAAEILREKLSLLSSWLGRVDLW